jgi:hypothetical protein
MALRPPVFDRDILPFDKAHLAQTTAKLIRKFRVVVRYRGIEETNYGLPFGLLCTHRKRPRCRNAANKADKFPSSHGRPLGRNVQE